MILYNLLCDKDHEFEGWFKDSKAYDRLEKARQVSCPTCGDTKVRKAIMAPRISKGGPTPREAVAPTPAPAPIPAPPPNPQQQKFMMALREMRKQIEANCDYVGGKFPEEARKIHYGEKEARSIYGEATPDEAKALSEEGIECQQIPWVPREDA
jgi:hypothetical protein